MTGGILSHQGLIGWPAAFLAAAIGSFLADQVFFTIGRRARDGRWVGKLRKRRVYTRVTKLMERYPVGFIFAFRFLYGLRTISPVALGTSHVSTRLFVAVNAASALCWAAIFTGIGYLFGEAFHELAARYRPTLPHILMAAGLVMVAAAIGWGVRALWLRYRKRTNRHEPLHHDLHRPARSYRRAGPCEQRRLGPVDSGDCGRALGIGRAPEHAAAHVWVVTRHEIDYRGNVVAGETVTAETWVPDPPKGARFDRHVRFLDAEGRVKVEAVTTWALIDRATGRLLRVTPEIAAPFFQL
ncbi:hypothetical protein GCM10020258_14970 [Sphingomonas yabuuchiae]